MKRNRRTDRSGTKSKSRTKDMDAPVEGSISEDFIPSLEDEEEEDDSDENDDDSLDDPGSLDEDEVSDEEEDGPPKKKMKKQRKDLYKPPTNEELNQLKETESHFHSSLFRLQISELLREVQMKAKRKGQIEETVKKLTKAIMRVPGGQKYELSDETWVSREKMKVPMHPVGGKIKGKFQFLAPQKVFIIGSCLTETCIKPDVVVDLAVEMPKEMLQQKDYMNHRYTRKRALYLCALARHLKNEKQIDDLKFSQDHFNSLKTVLTLTVKGDQGKPVPFRIHVTLESDAFKLNRFHVNKNSIRKQWYNREEMEEEDSECEQPSTPYYNSAILRDLTTQTTCACLESAFRHSQSFQEGLILLKVWLKQRQLSLGYGGFTAFHMAMYVAYLLSKRKLNKLMSSYQIVRNTLSHLSKSDWCKEGITLCSNSPDPHRPQREDFHRHFDVVFVDSTGYLNLCADMNNTTFYRVQHEARLALECLGTPGVDSFSCLFITPLPFERKFDHVFHIQGGDWFQTAKEKHDLHDRFMDYNDGIMEAILSLLMQYLELALHERVKLLQVQVLPEVKEWELSADPPAIECKGQVTVGLLLNPEYATNVLEKGPVADSPEAKDFREFWGDKSELRRFKDGSICEAVAWMASGTLSQRRGVCRQVIKHVLSRHFGIPPKNITYINHQLDPLLRQPVKFKDTSMSYDTGEEELQRVMHSYDAMCKILRNLKDLPLSISSIQGTSPVFRFTEVFAPLPDACKVGIQKGEGEDKRELPHPEKRCPVYVPSMKIICQLEGSGKWPEDHEAFRRLKAAFHIKLGETLADQQSLPVHVTPTHVDVKKDGFVFRIKLAYIREIALLKMYKTPQGMVKYKDTPEAMKLEREIQGLPKLTSTLHGLQQQYNTYSGVVRLAKRWVAAHLLTDYLAEEAIELLTAHLYITPAPYTPPCSLITGFQRWLYLVSKHDWKMSPLMVNLNKKFTGEDFTEIPSRFQKERSTLPLMFIATPDDKTMSVWTRKNPTAPILQRLVLLAEESLNVLSDNIKRGETQRDLYKQIFRPPLDAYDVIIHLRQKQCARQHQAVDATKTTFCPVYGEEPSKEGVESFLPVTDYDPVQCYIRELKEAYDHLALFFYDKYGGSLIGVLWKPSAFQTREFSVTHIKGRMVQNTGKDSEAVMVPNVEAIINDFRILGDGLVAGIEARTDRWNI